VVGRSSKMSILNQNFRTAINHIGDTRKREDKVVTNFAHTLSNARLALVSYRTYKSNNVYGSCNPAFVIEAKDEAYETMQYRLYQMAKNLFAMQRELKKEGFGNLVNQKINIGDSITEPSVKEGKPYDKIVGAIIPEESIRILLQLASEIIDAREEYEEYLYLQSI
jgi:hypothetical protein